MFAGSWRLMMERSKGLAIFMFVCSGSFLLLHSPGSFRVTNTPTDILSSMEIQFYCFCCWTVGPLLRITLQASLTGKFNGKKKKNADHPSVTCGHARFLSCLFWISCNLFMHVTLLLALLCFLRGWRGNQRLWTTIRMSQVFNEIPHTTGMCQSVWSFRDTTQMCAFIIKDDCILKTTAGWRYRFNKGARSASSSALSPEQRWHWDHTHTHTCWLKYMITEV